MVHVVHLPLRICLILPLPFLALIISTLYQLWSLMIRRIRVFLVLFGLGVSSLDAIIYLVQNTYKFVLRLCPLPLSSYGHPPKPASHRGSATGGGDGISRSVRPSSWYTSSSPRLQSLLLLEPLLPAPLRMPFWPLLPLLLLPLGIARTEAPPATVVRQECRWSC
jgi:hypothetical protein